ncbi:probable helicase senataxin isoform X4 [Ochotona curzoniae]|uniref:probable helicase senataxin isoform X4 n=1 Tax=Ochotona curzoniae TaxID=130825 RepID=UPI001B34D28E|nr:probable helicase senataxin isoform X4 [Ochotona curzoniae]
MLAVEALSEVQVTVTRPDDTRFPCSAGWRVALGSLQLSSSSRDRMSTCCWCTPGGLSTVDFLKRYAAKAPPDDFHTAEEDLCYCLECVAEYHRARDELPFLHEVLWELETLRLINHFEKSMKAEIGDNDELYIVDNNGEAQLFDFSGQDFENKLRVPLLEILKYPYLLLHERVNELCVEALCRMEQANCSFQVFDKHPGIYLFLVHPNEMVRRWAILTARNLGKVDRDDYYDLQEVLTCLFKVIELGLLESPDIYTSSVLEKGKLILLPSHMYDTTNYKNYWLGICMLLTILEEQAMDSLLLGSDKQNDFMQSILHTMERQSDDDSLDPFWPALHCFMVILDRLGSKVWGQLIDPIEAFQTIINNVSYNREIQNIRNSSVRTKLEPESYLDDMVTCSQIVYSYNPEKTKKDAGWRSAICPDYCPNMYEEMETLANVLQSDIGQDMRVHNSTFLWFIPFVQSLMDLKDLGVAYIVEVIHHLHSEVKDVLNQTDAVCDKVTEFFLLILVSVIELHKNKKCLHLLWVSSQQWVEAVVKCAKLPTTAFARSSEKSSGVNVFSSPSNSVQLASVHLILSLLKEGYQLGQQTLCKQYQDKLNGFIRQKNLSLGCQLTSQETHELQTCLKQIIRNIKFKVPQCNTSVDPTPTCKIPSIPCKEESDPMEKKFKKETHCVDNSGPTSSKEPMKADTHHMQENVSIQASSTVEDNEKDYMKDLKKGDDLSVQLCLKQNRSHFTERAHNQTKISTGGQTSADETCPCKLQKCSSRNGSDRGCDAGVRASTPSVTESGSLGKVSPSPLKGDGKIPKPKTKAQKDEICAKLSDVLKKRARRAASGPGADSVEKVAASDAKSLHSGKDAAGQSRARFWQNLSLVSSGLLDREKRELENEELDSYTSHRNKCKNQESPVDKNLGSCAELSPTSMDKTSPFRNCLIVHESRDKDMNKCADVLLRNLADQVPGFSPKSDILTDSQVDRDLHKLSLIAQASVIKFPSDSTQRSSSPLQRKVKDDKRHFKASQDNVGDRGQIIVISDSDDEEEERLLDFEKQKKQDKKCVKVCPEQSASAVSVEEKPLKEEKVADAAALWNQCDSTVANERVSAAEVVASASEEPSGGADLTARGMEVAGLKEQEPECGSDADDETLFLTQNDPEDMDLCSQMETFDDKLIEVIHGAADSGSGLQLESGHGPVSEHRACAGTVSSPGEHCAGRAEAGAAEDGVFRKPALPAAAAKPLRPSTRKIFTSSSTSRIANLSKSLENTSALRSSLKTKPSGRQSVSKEPHAGSAVSSKPMAEIQSWCNVGLPQIPNSSSRQRYTLPFGDSRSFFTSSPANTVFASQSISDTFVKEILKWKYEMFLNFDQCGPPASLCQSISVPVPVKFQDCEEYFNVFLPLMILNTFETVAQEWSSSPNKDNFYQLHLRKFPGEQKKYREFVVHLEECELAKQLHPKENDLVFLVPEQLNEETEDGERNCVQDFQKYHCGYVHKFRRTSVMRNGKSECSLSVQTQDDLPGKSNEIVKFKCVVISSLVTTQRKLKAMSLLSGRNQLARAILRPCSTDFCTQELPSMPSERIIAYLRDFNEDQKKAIETAYAMVKHLPSVAKICLIHGPPGTGKSKTIVGLLYCLLTENQRKGHPDENFNAKIKQNRVLVCAPSNAAVDELMKKIILEFKEKCKDKKNPLGNCGDINLVRLGPEKSINNEVLKFSLDSQVNHRMKKELPSHVQEMHRRKDCLDRQLDELSRKRALCRGAREAQRQELDEKIARVSKERQELASKIKEVQGRPQKTQNIIILESHIICCTLSTSGGLLLESAFRGQGGVPFSCVVVDEAGQSCEVETLTPLIHRCNKLILVGDPKQLPPTVISMKAQEYGYDQSMMARFYKLLEECVEQNVISRLPILQLTVQYRMHPDICLFPSNYIYNRNLKTSRLTESSRCSSDWPFQPYLVFDVGDGSERRDNDSYVNIQEIKLVMEIIKLIKDKRKDVTFRNIGIITHYKAQKTMIQKDLDREFDRKGPAEVDTVDAFQGRQKDCVIVTCVRANALQGSIGFLASLQRLNVTITRAKYSLFILGHLRTLMENPHWNQLIQDAQKRGAIIKTCDKNYRHDAMKILKLKPVLQRSLSHPLAAVPEAARPQGGLPSSAIDGGLARTSFASSLYHTLSDTKGNPVTPVIPERLPGQEQLRDPRLLRRMATEAKGALLQEPQPVSPQHPGSTPPSGEPGFPVARQDAGRAVQQAAGRATVPSTHRPYGQGGPPGAGPDALTSRRRYELEEELCPQREARAFREDGHERYYTRRASSWDRRRWEKEESGPKRRRL